MGVGLVGGDDLVQVLAQLVQRLGVVVPRLLQQVALRPLAQLVVQVGREAVDPADDHAGLLGQDLAGGEGVAGGPVLLQRSARAGRCPARRLGWPGSRGPASSPPRTPRRPGRRGGRRHGRRPGPRARRSGPGLVPAATRVWAVSAGSIDHTEASATVSSSAWTCAVATLNPVAGCGDRCHGSTQALATDTDDAQNPLFHRVLGHESITVAPQDRAVSRRLPRNVLSHRCRGREAGRSPRPEPASPASRPCRRPTRADPQRALTGPRTPIWSNTPVALFIGVDIGGTKVLAAAVSATGRVLRTATRETPGRRVEARWSRTR